jgi:uncharacterized protein (TIGR02147 family)
MTVFPEASTIKSRNLDSHEKAYQDAVLNASSGVEAIQKLIQLAKSFDAKVSLSYLCRRLGLSSKGFLSDVMNGKRSLGEKHWSDFADLFKLDTSIREILFLLLRLDNEKDADQKRLLTEEISFKRKAANYSEKILSNKLRGMFFAFDVFCAFGLFKNEPTKDELRRYFGTARGVELEVALNILLTLDLIEKIENGRYRIRNYNIRFSDSEDGLSHLDFLKESIEDARRSVEKWKEKRDESIFSSYIISVKQEHYRKVVDKLRRDLLEIQSGLESAEADLLVRFNIQVYPT